MAEAAETEKKLEPKCEAQDVGPCKIKLAIEVSAEKVTERIEDKYRELNESVALPGFRKGHAPRNLLERKFGKAMLDDLRFELAHHAFEEAKEERKLEPVGEPDLDPASLSVQEGKPFAFELTIEVRPTIELKSVEGLKVRKPALSVEDKEVDEVLESYRKSKAELVPAEDEAARAGDQAIFDFELVGDGKTLDRAENSALFLTEDVSFYGVPLPDFHKAAIGRKAGEACEVPVTLPENFAEKAWAGKQATLKATLRSLKRVRLPEVDAAFLKSFDMDTVEEFREDIRKRILKEKEEEAGRAMSEQLVLQLVEGNPFPMPEGLIESGAEEAVHRARLDLTMKGTPPEEIDKALEGEKTKSREAMEKALRAHFILEHVAQKEKIFVTEDQVEERVARMAAHYGRWPHEMKAALEEQGLLRQLRRQMREELVREYLLSKAVVEEGGK